MGEGIIGVEGGVRIIGVEGGMRICGGVGGRGVGTNNGCRVSVSDWV